MSYKPGSASPQTIEELYRFISEELRRISVAIEEGDYTPDPAEPPTGGVFEGNTYFLDGGAATEAYVIVSGVATPLSTL